ncbi:MAG: zinc-ribbon domain-containing protein [Chthoniobacter sp.]
MRHYQCSCGNILFFDNSTCMQCGEQVGYDSADDQMVTLTGESAFQRCSNGTQHGICNWVVPRGKLELLCASCLLDRTIPI